jgi:hypothetical protein
MIHERAVKKPGVLRDRVLLLDTCSDQHPGGVLPCVLFVLEGIQTGQNMRLGSCGPVDLHCSYNAVLSHMYLYSAGNDLYRNDVDGDTFYHITAAK